MDYHHKYIKYKTKYMNLKNKQSGGGYLQDFMLLSDDFENHGYIPKKYAYNANFPPTLKWYHPPEDTNSFVLIMTDIDAPTFTHWMVWNISRDIKIMTKNDYIQYGWQIGYNSFGKRLYAGPSPPKGQTHTYLFTLYALSDMIHVDININREDLLKTIEPLVLGKSVLAGRFASS